MTARCTGSKAVEPGRAVGDATIPAASQEPERGEHSLCDAAAPPWPELPTWADRGRCGPWPAGPRACGATARRGPVGTVARCSSFVSRADSRLRAFRPCGDLL